MNIRKLRLSPHPVTALCLTVALFLPCVVQAVSIGEIVLQSKLGEPLLAKVAIGSSKDESIKRSCLSLIAPDPRDGDTSGYLTQASLSLKTEGTRQYVLIRTHTAFNDVFARFRLQIRCPEVGSISKTLVILPDLAPISLPEAPSRDTVVKKIAPPEKQRVTRNALPETPKRAVVKTKPKHNKPRLNSIRASKKSAKEGSFRLQLSGEPLDETRIGKISTEERAFLLAKQKLLDADDQMASILTLQHQLLQMQDELTAIKSQLNQLGISPSTRLSASGISLSSATALPKQKTVNFARQLITQASDFDLIEILLVLLGLLLAIFAMWQGRRYYPIIKSRIANKQAKNTAASVLVLDESPPQQRATSTVPTAEVKLEKINNVPNIISPPAASATTLEVISLPPLQTIPDEMNEDDSMLEEAELYALHGRQSKAIEILQEINKRHPSNADAYPRLLSIYFSLGKVTEYEKTAKAFYKHHKDTPSWNGIQALGRVFDPNNQLYASSHNYIPTSSTSPIDQALLQLQNKDGSKQIAAKTPLKDLGDFMIDSEPAKHEVDSKTLPSLNTSPTQASDQPLPVPEESVETEAKPLMHDMSNFLNFSSEGDVTVADVTASSDANIVEKQDDPKQVDKAPEPAPASDGIELDLSFEIKPKQDLPDLEFHSSADNENPLGFVLEPSFMSEEPSPKKDEPAMDFVAESAKTDFPEIDLEMLSPQKKNKKTKIPKE